jgi:leucyl-tRNA synthetase
MIGGSMAGAIFGCPAHDARDLEFACKYNVRIEPGYALAV